MRQDKTMKVISNHVVDPRITLEPNAGSDKSWVWSAFDFSQGELEETVFAMRFGDAEKAGNFKKEFELAKEHMAKEVRVYIYVHRQYPRSLAAESDATS